MRVHRLGLPQDSRDAFALTAEAGLIAGDLTASMQAMVGFRNIAIHDYRKLSIPIVRSILAERLPYLQAMAAVLIRHAG